MKSRKQLSVVGKLKRLQLEAEEDTAHVVQLGDASIAAPFTSKSSSVMPGIYVANEFRIFFYNNFI